MIDKTYNPGDHEQEIYKLWEESGAFTPKIVGRRSVPVGNLPDGSRGQASEASRKNKSSDDQRPTTNRTTTNNRRQTTDHS